MIIGWKGILVSTPFDNQTYVSQLKPNNDFEPRFGTKEKISEKSVLHSASRLNCGLIMPSGPSEMTNDKFLMETYRQVLARKARIHLYTVVSF